jgi:hypothetical protein
MEGNVLRLSENKMPREWEECRRKMHNVSGYGLLENRCRREIKFRV